MDTNFKFHWHNYLVIFLGVMFWLCFLMADLYLSQIKYPKASHTTNISYNPGSHSSTSLINAAYTGNLGLVKQLVESGVNINKTAKDGCSPIIAAIQKGHLEIIKYLVEQGADINRSDRWGSTPLMRAIPNYKIVKLLVKHKANIYAVDKRGFTAVDVAALSGDIDLVDYLTKQGAKITNFTLLCSLNTGKLSIVKFLYSKNKNLTGIMSHTHASALMLAAEHGELSIAKYLLSKGININLRNEWGNSALSLAMKKNNKNMISFLIKQGAK